MNIHRILLLASILLFSCSSYSTAQRNDEPGSTVKSEKDIYLIDSFEDDSVGAIPAEWYNRDGSSKVTNLPPDKKEGYLYRVREEDGNHFLRYDGISAKHINYPLINREGIDIYETPILSWKWRVHDLPANASEDSNDRNDAAASIYMVFDFANYVVKKLPISIRYTWSSTLPEGTQASKFFSKQKILVLESGKEKMGKWIQFERNLIKDYKELHGEKPPRKPVALLILSDGNSTQDSAKADYDDIMLKPASSKK